MEQKVYSADIYYKATPNEALTLTGVTDWNVGYSAVTLLSKDREEVFIVPLANLDTIIMDASKDDLN